MKVIPWKNGEVITEPGIYSGVPMSAYHGQDICDGPSISSTGLRKLFSESPAHFYDTWSGNPDAEDQSDKAAFTLGRAAHHLILGEDDYSSLFVQRPAEIGDKPWQGNRTECKDWLKAQAKAGRTVLTEEQVKSIRGMARSLGAHPLVQSGLLNGLVEHSMFWKCPHTGIWLKARPDVIPEDSGTFADLKTTPSVQALDLKRSMADFGYFQQAALVLEGWQMLTGEAGGAFCFAFVEKQSPYCVRFVVPPDEDLIRGERANFAAKELFAQCIETGVWPGPGENDAEYLSLPEWAQKQIDYRLGLADEAAA